MKPEDYDHKCETAGNYPSDNLTISCGIHMCGKITNGVAFRFENRGGWVLDYADLKAAYELATERRSPAAGDPLTKE